MDAVAAALGLRVHVVPVRDRRGLDAALAALPHERADALCVLSDPMFFEQRQTIVNAAARQRIPAIYEFRDFVDVGGLMSYGTRIEHMYARAAAYVDRIPKGARPADLPVEQPTTFELVINLKTARELGLVIAPSVLARADAVVE